MLSGCHPVCDPWRPAAADCKEPYRAVCDGQALSCLAPSVCLLCTNRTADLPLPQADSRNFYTAFIPSSLLPLHALLPPGSPIYCQALPFEVRTNHEGRNLISFAFHFCRDKFSSFPQSVEPADFVGKSLTVRKTGSRTP